MPLSYISDRDPGDETPEEHPETGLCSICHEDAAVPNDEFCRSCLAEVERELWLIENPDEAA